MTIWSFETTFFIFGACLCQVLLCQKNKSKDEHDNHDQHSPQVGREKILVRTIKSRDDFFKLLHSGNDRNSFFARCTGRYFSLKI